MTTLDKTNKRPILVTGAHRSGSTWVGTMIGKSEEVCYMLEPFNFHYGPGICNAPFEYHFPYVTKENEAAYYGSIKQTLDYKYHLWRELFSVKSGWQLRRCSRDYFAFKAAKKKGKRPLFKDPIAFFSAEWLAERFGFQVVMLIRHPAAFASSIKRLDWSHPFEDFLRQPALMDGPLKEYKSQVEDFARNPRDLIDQSILLWNMIYAVALQYQEAHPDWIFAKHENISLDPVAEFKQLFEKLDLEFTPAIETEIRSYTDSSNPVESPRGETILKMNSKSNIFNWKKRLAPEEVERIRKGTETVAGHFYSPAQWGD
jgi:hypothetical protein